MSQTGLRCEYSYVPATRIASDTIEFSSKQPIILLLSVDEMLSSVAVDAYVSPFILSSTKQNWSPVSLADRLGLSKNWDFPSSIQPREPVSVVHMKVTCWPGQTGRLSGNVRFKTTANRHNDHTQ